MRKKSVIGTSLRYRSYSFMLAESRDSDRRCECEVCLIGHKFAFEYQRHSYVQLGVF